MPPTPTVVTPNYNFSLPTVGGDTNIWGILLNANWSAADLLFKSVADELLTVVDMSVGPTAPLSPKVGDLWFKTTAPANLFVWVGAPTNAWVLSTPTPPPPVSVGDTAPVGPLNGQLWFKTASPVGLFIWFTDVDSSQWVQVGGSGGGGGGSALGSITYFASPNAPAGWLVCDGEPVTSANAALRSYLLAAGSPYGVSGLDPRVPDLRGEFIRGWDDARGVDPGRAFGSAQGDGLRAHGHTLFGANSAGPVPSGIGLVAGTSAVVTTTSLRTDVSAAMLAAGGIATRPRNVALLPCIKASGDAGTPTPPPLGVDQVWTTVPPASRPVDTPHQNTTGRPIMVAISGRSAIAVSRAVQVSENGTNWVQVGWQPTLASAPTQTSFTLPAAHYWRIVGSMDAANYLVSELS